MCIYIYIYIHEDAAEHHGDQRPQSGGTTCLTLLCPTQVFFKSGESCGKFT